MSKNLATKKVIKDFLKTKDFSAIEVCVSQSDAKEWVRMKIDPWRFAPANFIGDWADPNINLEFGEIRILKVVVGSDNVARAITRQGKNLFCFPWIK